MTTILSLLKTGLIAAIFGALIVPGIAEDAEKSPAEKSNAHYYKAMRAEQEGDAAGAMAAYKAALELNPKNANARYRMGQLKKNYAKVASKGRETTLKSVIISEYNVSDADLDESLKALSTMVEKQSKGKVTANFVIQDPDKKLKNAKVNLTLKNVPATGILKYVLDQAGAKARYDEYAVLIIPH